jgi:hypothetical protein
MEKTPPTSYRFSPEYKRLIAALAAKLGISHVAVLEIAIRAMAQKEKVD